MEPFSSDIDLDYGLIVRKSDNGKSICISFVPSEILDGTKIKIPTVVHRLTHVSKKDTIVTQK